MSLKLKGVEEGRSKGLGLMRRPSLKLKGWEKCMVIG
jgi:hypothetical protein